MIEKEVEQYLADRIKKAGGLCWKFTSPGTRGVPDRWCALGGRQFFVELKRPNHKARPDEKLQAQRHKQMREAGGAHVYQIDSKAGVDVLLRYVSRGILPDPVKFARL